MPAFVDKIAKRERLVEIAADVFAMKGFHATKMQDIANAADVAKGTLYEYFTTKEDLFLAVYDAWMSEYESTVRRRFNEAEDTISRAEAVRESAVEFYTRRAKQAPLLLEFWAHALRSDNPAFLARIRSMFGVLTGLGENITRDLVAAGVFTSVDIPSVTLLEAGISDGIFLLWVISGQQFPLDVAYIFRQSLLGVGLLSDDGRAALTEHLREKLEAGFLPDNFRA